jgi:hypothetical protein
MAQPTQSSSSTHAQEKEEQKAYEIRENRTTQAIDRQTAKIPTDVFFVAALGSIGASAYLQYKGNRNMSLFVGQWAPAFLTIGVYNKLVKMMGND